MFMILGTAIFLVLMGSAVLGAVMLLISLGLTLTRTWWRAGLIIFGAGVIGAALGVMALVILSWLLGLLDTPAETWIMFSAAGFGWASLVSGSVLVLIAMLRQSNSWVERRRHSNI
ncbi:MAG: hypothetical protein KF834_10250 [Burkholderiales bacterium]|nr:hypothetical protein [Burkholderiales bacterium]